MHNLPGVAKIFITGSADGLGHLTAKDLIAKGHQVVIHARSEKRGLEAMKKLPGAENVVTGDLGNISQTIELASKVNALGTFDAVIQNAGVYHTTSKELLTVNTLAPYILTSLIQKPARLIYLSSGLQSGGRFNPESFKATMNGVTYSDTKLHVLMLCKAITRKWTNVYANAVNPGWVATKMGGPGAPDDLKKGYETQVWLAVSNDDKAKVSGHLFYHQKQIAANKVADDVQLQEKFLHLCQELTGVSLT
jgi:NAD(P)-dependent dehydrogenase (short-subunit alcohol dehydrogenase family)